MTIDPTLAYAAQEVARLVVAGNPPNGVSLETCGDYAELVTALHDAYTDAAQMRQLAHAQQRPDIDADPLGAVRATWRTWSVRPEYRNLAGLVQQASVTQDGDDADLWWLRGALAVLPAVDAAALRTLLRPVLDRVAAFRDEALVVAALEELRTHYKWNAATFRAYQRDVTRLRTDRLKAQRREDADAPLESEELGESEPPPIFLSPALAYHDGIVYVSQMMSFKATRRNKSGPVTATVWRPVIITSDRRRMLPIAPPQGAPDGAVTWLDPDRRLALEGGAGDAPSGRWSYDGMVQFLHGAVEAPQPHEVFDDLMASLKRYVYHADESSYVVDVLWTMGTYFYRLWNAYPYLALHGEKGAGKTTLLTWLGALCFNAQFVVNTSEASLYRSIQAHAPTLLIDEQEGLNSSKAAREQKADLMGILKSGYKAGARVARQDMERKEITRYFDVYSPKALAAIELFEDVLENRAILTYMQRKPASITLHDDSVITTHDAQQFAPLRDRLYLLLMHRASDVLKCTERVQMEYHNRMRELLRPLYALAALVDASRGAGRQTLDLLDIAAAQKHKLREERDRLTPEATLKEALRFLCEQATDDPTDYTYGYQQDDGTILVDTIQVRAAFVALFSSNNDSFFNDTWFGKQVAKLGEAVRPAVPRRRRRRIYQAIGEDEVRQVNVYVLNPALL